MSRVSVAQMVNDGPPPKKRTTTKRNEADPGNVFRTEQAPEPLEVLITTITPNPWQPRTRFDQAALDALTASIAESGVIQPLVVRPGSDADSWQLVAGERRLRAATAAGLTHVPVTVRQVSDADMPVVALIENLQRDDLNPVEEAEAISNILNASSLTQADLAQKLGTSRASVAHAVALTKLPEQIKDMVRAGDLSRAHAKALTGLAASNPAAAIELADLAAAENMSSGDLEEAVRRASKSPTTGQKPQGPKRVRRNRHGKWHRVAASLRETIGAPVVIRSNDSGGGVITIRYSTEQEFETVVGNLGVEISSGE